MAMISAISLIRSLSIFHLTAAYFLLTSPITIINQNLVLILGAAMDLPLPSSFTQPSPPLALLSAVLAVLAISDFTAASLPQETSSFYWSSQAPVRLMFFFILTFYSYAFKPGGILSVRRDSVGISRETAEGRNDWDNLKNGLVFSWGFLEMMIWFWIFVTLRDERREALLRKAEKRKAEVDRL